MFAALLPVLAPILGDVIRRLVPDQGEQGRIEAELSIALMQRAQEIETAAADIVKTEAASEHWLTATWRPVVMLVLTSLIVARWLGYSAPGISEAEALDRKSVV